LKPCLDRFFGPPPACFESLKLIYSRIEGQVSFKKIGNMRNRLEKHRAEDFVEEDAEWLDLTPQQRIRQSARLWQLYIALGGSLDPEPDPDSPFYPQETPR